MQHLVLICMPLIHLCNALFPRRRPPRASVHGRIITSESTSSDHTGRHWRGRSARRRSRSQTAWFASTQASRKTLNSAFIPHPYTSSRKAPHPQPSPDGQAPPDAAGPGAFRFQADREKRHAGDSRPCGTEFRRPPEDRQDAAGTRRGNRLPDPSRSKCR
jgi:hypothetical protein